MGQRRLTPGTACSRAHGLPPGDHRARAMGTPMGAPEVSPPRPPAHPSCFCPPLCPHICPSVRPTQSRGAPALCQMPPEPAPPCRACQPSPTGKERGLLPGDRFQREGVGRPQAPGPLQAAAGEDSRPGRRRPPLPPSLGGTPALSGQKPTRPRRSRGFGGRGTRERWACMEEAQGTRRRAVTSLSESGHLGRSALETGKDKQELTR